MSKIEEYLMKLEHKLLIESDRHSIKLTRDWAKSFPKEAAVYLFREEGEVCFVGEAGSLQARMLDILGTKTHPLRRNMGESKYSNPSTYEKANSNKGYSKDIENILDDKISDTLTMSYILVNLGRKELEESLIERLKPKYNSKGTVPKTYSMFEKKLINNKAYDKWTSEDDENLERLFCEGRSVKELSEIFQRNKGAIESRIKKLELKEKYGG